MFRLARLALMIVICIASLSCQTYTTGLEKSLAKADETAATAALRTIAVAQQTYSISNDQAYGTFQQLVAGGYLDERFNSDKPALKDYVLTMEVGRESEGPYFRVHADPTGNGATAGRYFYIDGTTVLRVNATRPASVTDPVVER